MRPQLWMVAGANGVGKSTLTERFLSKRIEVINPDNIAAIAGVHPVAAGKKAIEQQNELLSAKKSFAIETTLSGQHELTLMQKAKLLNYKINLIFLCAQNPMILVGRVEERVKAGGHYVSTSDVIRRMNRGKKNLSAALSLAERAWILDNTSEKLRLLLSIESGKIKHRSSNLPEWLKIQLQDRN